MRPKGQGRDCLYLKTSRGMNSQLLKQFITIFNHSNMGLRAQQLGSVVNYIHCSGGSAKLYFSERPLHHSALLLYTGPGAPPSWFSEAFPPEQNLKRGRLVRWTKASSSTKASISISLGYNTYSSSPCSTLHSTFPSSSVIPSADLGGLPGGRNQICIPEISELLIIITFTVQVGSFDCSYLQWGQESARIQMDHQVSTFIPPSLHCASSLAPLCWSVLITLASTVTSVFSCWSLGTRSPKFPDGSHNL